MQQKITKRNMSLLMAWGVSLLSQDMQNRLVFSAMQSSRRSTLGQQPVLYGKGRRQGPFMVQDIDWEQQVVIVHFTLVLPSYYDWPLIFGLLPRHNRGDDTCMHAGANGLVSMDTQTVRCSSVLH